MASIPSTSKTSIREILPRTGAAIGTSTVVDHQGLAVVQRAVRDAVRAVALRKPVALGDPGPARRRAVRHEGEADQPQAVVARLVARLVHRLEATQAGREHAGAGAVAAVDDAVGAHGRDDRLVGAARRERATQLEHVAAADPYEVELGKGRAAELGRAVEGVRDHGRPAAAAQQLDQALRVVAAAGGGEVQAHGRGPLAVLWGRGCLPGRIKLRCKTRRRVLQGSRWPTATAPPHAEASEAPPAHSWRA